MRSVDLRLAVDATRSKEQVNTEKLHWRIWGEVANSSDTRETGGFVATVRMH